MRSRPANRRFLSFRRRIGMTYFILGLASYQRRRLSQKNSAGPGFPDSGGAHIILFDRPVFDSRLLDQDRVLALRVYLNPSTKVV